jgi:hypothetical protein
MNLVTVGEEGCGGTARTEVLLARHPPPSGKAEASTLGRRGVGRPPAHAARELRRREGGEARLPPVAAVLVAAALHIVLPDPLQIGPRLLIPGTIQTEATNESGTRRQAGSVCVRERCGAIASALPGHGSVG